MLNIYNYCDIINFEMESAQFMGLLIGAIATLLSIASIIVAILVKPVISLNQSITKLNDSIDRLNMESENLGARVTAHGKEIDENKIHLAQHDKDIEHIKEQIR